MERESITLLGHAGSVYDVAWLPDGRSVVSGGRDTRVRIWDVDTGTTTRTWQLPGSISSLTIAPRSELIVAAWEADDQRGGVTVLDRGRDKPLTVRKLGHRMSSAWLDDEDCLVAVGANAAIYRWASVHRRAKLIARRDLTRGTYHARARRDASGAVLACEGGASFVRFDSPGDETFVFIAEQVRFLDVAPWRESVYAVSAQVRQGGHLGSDLDPDLFEILLWDTAQDERPPWDDSLLGHLSWARGLDFSPDGSLLSSSGFDGSAFVWDPFSALERAELRGHRGAVYWAKFSPDGRSLVTACADGAVRVWSLDRVLNADSSRERVVVLEADDDLEWEPGPGRDLDLVRTKAIVELLLEARSPDELDELVHRSLPFTDRTPNFAALQALNIRAEQARRAGDDAEVAHCRAVQAAIQNHGDTWTRAMMGFGNRAASAPIEPASEPLDRADEPDHADLESVVAVAASGDTETARRALAPHLVDVPGQHALVGALADLHGRALRGAEPLTDVIRALERVLELLPDTALAMDRILCLDMTGSLYCLGGDNTTGSIWLAQAHDLAESDPDCPPVLRALAAEHYGNALRNVGDLLPAFDLLARAVDGMREVGGQALIEALVNLSVVCGDLGRREEQGRLLNEAVRIASIAGMKVQLAACLFGLANLKAETAGHAEAIDDLRKAAAAAIDAEDMRLAAKIKGSLGEAFRAAGEVDNARVAYRESYELSEQLGDRGSMAFCLVGQAKLAEEEGREGEARTLFRETLELTRGQEPRRHWAALRDLAALERKRDPETALRLLEEGASIGERMRSGARVSADAPDIQEKLAATYNGRIAIMLEHGDAETLFDETERARAALIAHHVGGDRTHGERPLESVARAVERLGPQAVLVSYYRIADEVLIFVLRSGESSVQLERRPLRSAELAAIDSDAGDEIRRPPGARTRETWTRLAATVLDPVLPLLRDGDRLFVAPHGPLHRLPLHALPAGERRVIERWPVTYVPCASLLDTLPALSAPPPARRQVVGSFFPAEAQDVAALLGSEDDARRDGAAKDVALAAFAKADLVHVSGHGFQYPYFPLASGVVLAPSAPAERYVELIGKHPDTWSVSDRQQLPELRHLADPDLLTVKDIDELTVAPELVCLSACSSGVVGTDITDEPMGLVPSLLRAGARGVVATLWLVDAEVTRSFVSSFYSNLFPTGWPDVAKALQQAVVATIAEHPEPYYWAPFALVGGLTDLRNGRA